MAGTYKSLYGNQACTACPKNTSSSVGNLSLSACVCNAGFTTENDGSCSACASGKFKTVTG
jgi:hypothetical protein